MTVTAPDHGTNHGSPYVAWFDAIYRDIDEGWVSLFSIVDATGDTRVDWAPVDNYDQLAEHVAHRTPDGNVWFGVATREKPLTGRRRGREEACRQLSALWVDIDIAGPQHVSDKALAPSFEIGWQIIRSFPMAPSAVVHSGFGLQPWWFLDEPVGHDEAQALLVRWGATWNHLAARLGCEVDNVFDLARVMRVPGTLNHKSQPPVPVQLLELHPDRRYGTDDLDDILDEAPEPPSAERRERVPYLGPERPGDAYNARHDGSEILESLGFTLHHVNSDGQHWTRPGKDRRHGTSVTIYADGHIMNYSDTVAARWPGFAKHRSFDPAGLYAAVHHDGDFVSAMRELRQQGYGSERPRVELSVVRATADDGTDPENYLDPDLDEFLGVEDEDYDWLVEGLLERGDRTIVTGPEGGGKSTLLRQLAIQMASGIHPFTLEAIDPLQVLLVDCENSARQARRALRGLRDVAGDSYLNGKLRLRVLGHSIELAKADVMADIGARIEAQEVDVLIIGPLYKLLDDDPVKEMPAKAVADAIDWLRARRQSAILIEAHSPYADGGGRARPVRPYGASLWSRWPEFGLHLGPDGVITHWRGQRDERAWPKALERSTPWPWAPKYEATAEPKAWDGPTQCYEAILAFFHEVGGEYSTNQLTDRLRERGHSFRKQTVSQAARIGHERGLLDCRTGPRAALLYSPAMERLGGIVLDRHHDEEEF